MAKIDIADVLVRRGLGLEVSHCSECPLSAKVRGIRHCALGTVIDYIEDATVPAEFEDGPVPSWCSLRIGEVIIKGNVVLRSRGGTDRLKATDADPDIPLRERLKRRRQG